MYGVVNKSIRDFIVGAHGIAVWEKIRDRAAVDVDAFISNEPYPDEISYKLVGAAVDVLGISSTDFLTGLGEFWILKTGMENYGPLLNAGGETFKDFLLNLNQFHLRVQLIYPELKPPDFTCTDIQSDRLKLHYRTHRPGMTDFVVGLLKGLGEFYKTPVAVALIESKADGADHDVFDVIWATAALERR
jgi:hypothetical protein